MNMHAEGQHETWQCRGHAARTCTCFGISIVRFCSVSSANDDRACAAAYLMAVHCTEASNYGMQEGHNQGAGNAPT
jgi:hypothetical protein